MFDTLAPQHPPRVRHSGLDEHLDQRRLAESCLAGQEYQPPFAALRFFPDPGQPFQKAFAADPACALGSGLAAGGGHPCHGVFTGRYHRPHGGHEPITFPCDRLQVAGRPGVIAQNLAQFADAAFEGRLAHMAVPPHGVEQLILADQPVRMCHQVAEYGKGLRPQRHRFTLPPQALIGGLQPERLEQPLG